MRFTSRILLGPEPNLTLLDTHLYQKASHCLKVSIVHPLKRRWESIHTSTRAVAYFEVHLRQSLSTTKTKTAPRDRLSEIFYEDSVESTTFQS